MKTELAKKLNLGRELSKNDQKKVLGGATLSCYVPGYGDHNVQWYGSCGDYASQVAYCHYVYGNNSLVDGCF